MSDKGRDTKLYDCLFNGQKGKILNVKFFRGHDEFISADSLKSEFCASVVRGRKARSAGEPSVVPRCRKTEPLDLRRIVADMA